MGSPTGVPVPEMMLAGIPCEDTSRAPFLPPRFHPYRVPPHIVSRQIADSLDDKHDELDPPATVS